MAQNQSEINIQVIAQDLASKTLEAINTNMAEMAVSSKKGSDGMAWAFTKAQVVVALLQKGLSFVKNIIGGVIDGFKNMVKAIGDFAVEYSRRGGEIQNVSIGFNRMFKDNEQALQDLREGAQGTISDYDLMLNANKASMLGVTSNSKELAKLLEISRARAQALGVDSTFAFESIATGIGRMSPLILDNLGITTSAYKEQVKVLEDAGVVVDDNMKKQLLLKNVLDDESKVTMTLGVMWEQLSASFQNAKDNVATGLIPIFTEVGEVVLPFVTTAMENLSKKFVAFALEIWPKVKESAIEWKDFFITWWEENKEKVTARVVELNQALGGDTDSLKSALLGLLDPSEESKNKLGELASWGVDMLFNALVGEDGNGGLVNASKELIEQIGEIDEQEWESIKTGIGATAKAVVTLANGINKMAENYNKLKKTGMLENRIFLGIATLGLSEAVRFVGKTVSNPDNTSRVDYVNGVDVSGNAYGGLAGGLTRVGERGSELLRLPSGSRVYTNEETKNMGGSGITININAPVTGVDHLQEVIASAVDEVQSRQNRLANYNIL